MNSLLHKNNPSSTPAIFHDRARLFVLPKLTVNKPGDSYEEEADAMADRVMRMSSNETVQPVTGLIGKSLQRKCAHCEEEEKKGKPIMRTAAAGNSGLPVSSSFAATLNASKGSGSPLPKVTRSFMENAFSTDFSSVKIHTGAQAAKMSKGINAKAFTYGNDIYFNEGQYSPVSEEGKYLLAHELTHTVQQGGTAISNKVIQLQPGPPAATPTLAGLTATRIAFNNTGAVDAANCASLLPAGLGVDGPGTGRNGMEMVFRINGAIPAGTEFEITRTKATGVWQFDGGAWTRLGGWPAGTSDDHHDQDECQLPVGRRIFVIDTPGAFTLDPTGTVFPNTAGPVAGTATAFVWKLSFAEWVIARNRSLGIDWIPISTPLFHRWHSILSVSNTGGVWSRVNTPGGLPNEIELGNISISGASP